MYDWVPSLFTWNYHHIVKQLYLNTEKSKKLKRMFLKKIDNQQGPTISPREFCSIFCHNLNGQRIDTCICKNK